MAVKAESTIDLSVVDTKTPKDLAQEAKDEVTNITRKVVVTDEYVQIIETVNEVDEVVAEFKARALSLGKNFTASETGNGYEWGGVEMLNFLAGFFQLGASFEGDPSNDYTEYGRMGVFPTIELKANSPVSEDDDAYMKYNADAHIFNGNVYINGRLHTYDDYSRYPYNKEITLDSHTACFGYATSSQKDWIILVPMPQRLYGIVNGSLSGTLSYTLRGSANTQSGTATLSQIQEFGCWGNCLYIRVNKNVAFGTNNTSFAGFVSGLTFKLAPYVSDGL